MEPMWWLIIVAYVALNFAVAVKFREDITSFGDNLELGLVLVVALATWINAPELLAAAVFGELVFVYTGGGRLHILDEYGLGGMSAYAIIKCVLHACCYAAYTWATLPSPPA